MTYYVISIFAYTMVLTALMAVSTYRNIKYAKVPTVDMDLEESTLVFLILNILLDAGCLWAFLYRVM